MRTPLSTYESDRTALDALKAWGAPVVVVILALLVSAAPALAEIPDPAGTIYDGGSCIEPDGSTGRVGIDGTCTTAADYDVLFSYELLAATTSLVVDGRSVAEVYGITPETPPASTRPIGDGLVEEPRSFRQILNREIVPT